MRLPCLSVMFTVAHDRVNLETSKFVGILLIDALIRFWTQSGHQGTIWYFNHSAGQTSHLQIQDTFDDVIIFVGASN
jgi:hypothetical protein